MNDVKAGDNWLSYLPMAWVGDAAPSRSAWRWSRGSRQTAGKPETVQRDLRELGPDAMLAPPHLGEHADPDADQGHRRVADQAPRLRAFPQPRRGCELKQTDGGLSLGKRLGLALGEVLVYGPVRDQLRLRKGAGATQAARRSADTYRFFRSFGINLKQVYGATEASALIACQNDAEANPNTVGRPIPQVDIKIDDRGEVLLKGPNVFRATSSRKR